MPSGQPVIAVLDDEGKMRVALQRLLSLRGYAVAEFDTGPELLKACAERAMGCIILDLHMPEMNGFEVLEQLSRQPDAPPVIAITGHDQAGDEERVTRLGACVYFTKPVDGAALLDAISKLTGIAPLAPTA